MIDNVSLPGIEAMVAALLARNQPPPCPLLPVTQADIDAAAQAFGQPLPADFITLHLSAGNVRFGLLEPVTLQPNSGHTQFNTVLADAQAYGVPPGLLPICETNADFFVMLPDGTVRFWSHDDGELTDEQWPTLAAWVQVVWLSSDY